MALFSISKTDIDLVMFILNNVQTVVIRENGLLFAIYFYFLYNLFVNKVSTIYFILFNIYV